VLGRESWVGVLLILCAVGRAGAQTTGAGIDPEVTRDTTDQSIYELDPVVVTATRSLQSLSTAPASISVVDARALRIRPTADLTDALRDLPGISLSAGTQGRRGIQIRGMDPSYTLILIDGKRIDSGEALFRHNDFDISLIPTASIERIEVVRGGMSALYGSEALGGVINIITRRPARGWEGSLSSEIQSPTSGSGGEEYRLHGRLSGSLIPGRLGLTLSGSYSERGVWHAWSPGPVLGPDDEVVTRPDGSVVNWDELATLEGRTDHSGRAKLSWTPSSHHTFDLEYGIGHQTRFGEYYISNWGIADVVVDRHDLVLSHRAELSWGRTELRGYGESIETNDGLEQRNVVAEGSLNFGLGAHQFTAGAEARWVDLSSPAEFASGAASVQQQALFLQDELVLSSSLRLLGGARLDHHENFGLHLTPRGYLVYTPIEHLTLKGGVGTAFKAPTLRQLSDESMTPSCRGACLIVGNPDLSPERSVSYELSGNYNVGAWAGSLTAFQNEITDLIDTPRGAGVTPIGTGEDGLPLHTPVNINRARVRGLEATLRRELGEMARLSGNYTLLDAVDLDAERELDYRPRHNLNGQLDLSPGPRTTLFLRGQYLGKQRSGELTLEPYTLLDLGGTHRLNDRFTLRVGILNIADTRTDDQAKDYAFVERGRTAYLGLSAEL